MKQPVQNNSKKQKIHYRHTSVHKTLFHISVHVDTNTKEIGSSALHLRAAKLLLYMHECNKLTS